jgi:hypothetical protein
MSGFRIVTERDSNAPAIGVVCIGNARYQVDPQLRPRREMPIQTRSAR